MVIAPGQGRVVKLNFEDNVWQYNDKDEVIRVGVGNDSVKAAVRALCEYFNDIKNYQGIFGDNRKNRRSPGLVIYAPQEGGILVYMVDKVDGESKGEEDPNKMHAERQLIQQVEKDNNQHLRGQLYIYTWQSPCIVAPTDYPSNGSCIEYYIAKVEEHGRLTILIRVLQYISFIYIEIAFTFIKGQIKTTFGII